VRRPQLGTFRAASNELVDVSVRNGISLAGPILEDDVTPRRCRCRGWREGEGEAVASGSRAAPWNVVLDAFVYCPRFFALRPSSRLMKKKVL